MEFTSFEFDYLLSIQYFKWIEKPNVQINHFGEVQFFFRTDIGGDVIALALVSEFGPPDNELLAESSKALWVSRYLGNANL